MGGSDIDAAMKIDYHLKYFLQYHNVDKMGYFPDTESMDISNIEFETSIRQGLSFYTSKRIVKKTVGEKCFLVVGAGTNKKQYYLWSYMSIGHVSYENNEYVASGEGFNFQQPILLNNVPGFLDFKYYCGNFGIGFQEITNHVFCRFLVDLANSVDVLPGISKIEEVNSTLGEELRKENERMENVSPDKLVSEIEKTIRKDRKIVGLLKKAANYSCVFPDCHSAIKTRTGLNYVEVAHIKPVHKGGKSVIGNLFVLCPNHHKEFDHGDLKIVEQSINKLRGSLNGIEFYIVFPKTEMHFKK